MVREKMRTMRAHVAKMSELFHEADTSGARSLKTLEAATFRFRGSFYPGVHLCPQEPGASRTGVIRGYGSFQRVPFTRGPL